MTGARAHMDVCPTTLTLGQKFLVLKNGLQNITCKLPRSYFEKSALNKNASWGATLGNEKNVTIYSSISF